MTAGRDIMPPWLASVLRRHCQIRSLHVPAYVDLETSPEKVKLYPKCVWLGSTSGYLVARIERSSGQILIKEEANIGIPEELLHEPSIRPVIADLSINYLEEDLPLDCRRVILYLDDDSDVSLGRLRAVAFVFVNERQLVLDPYWSMGIRIGGESDVVRLENDISGVRALEVVLQLPNG